MDIDFNALSDEEQEKEEDEWFVLSEDAPFLQWAKGLLHLIVIMCCCKSPKINIVFSVVDDTRNLRGNRRLMTTCTHEDVRHNSLRFYLVQRILSVDGATADTNALDRLRTYWNENPVDVYKDDSVLASNQHRTRMQMIEKLACCLDEASQTGHSVPFPAEVKALAEQHKVQLYEGPAVECMPFFFAFELVTQDEDQIRQFLYKVGYGDHADFPALSTLRCLLTHGFTEEARTALKNIIGDDRERQERHAGLQVLTTLF